MIKHARLATLAALLVSSAALAQPAPSPTPVKEAPPNGPGLGAPHAVPVNTAPIQLTPAELKELGAVEQDFDRFTAAAAEHQARMRAIAKTEFDSRTADVEKRYAERIAHTDASRSKHHAEAIALLEKFIKNHPSHETYTPDQMYRLADLYLDVADEEVEAKLAAQDTGAAPPPGTDNAIVADYSRSIALWDTILDKFPKYRQTPAVLYLDAYYGKTTNDRRSLELFLALACANKYKWNDAPPVPPTRADAIKRASQKTLRDPYADCTPYPEAETELVRHAWVRGIADYHFTVPGELDDAIAAYLKVANGGNDSRLYAEALYKLAWSYYKRDYLLDSIKRFDESVKLYDSIVASGGTPALELRDESIQYIAVAFTDPWEGENDSDPIKAFDRAKKFYAGRENEPHVRDVWVAMGHAFEELQAWDQAVDAFRVAIGPPWELNPKNPVVHQEIVNAFEQKGDKFAADTAAGELATRYAPGTAWYAANEKDRDAMESQRRIAERALYAAARNTHSAATEARKEWEASRARDPQGKRDYLALYSKAIDLYRTFVQQYPDSDYVYEFMFQQGEALYFSERYMEAAQQYRWVRDHKDVGTQYYLDAAKSVVQSYEAEAKQQVAAGKIAELKVPTGAQLKALPQPLTPQPIPEIYQQLQTEWDNYQNVVNDPKSAPQQGINAALVSLAYLHLDDAIVRFNKVMAKFCGNPEAVKAKDGLLSIYQATDQIDKFEQTNVRFISTKCGDTKSIELAMSQNRSIELQRAGDLYKNKQYMQAAEVFYRFYKTAPNTDPDLPTALYDTAVAYKLADKPKTAIALFKEFTQNTSKQFRESPYYLDAIRLTAASYQSAFDYDNAIATYLQLYDTAKKAKRLGIKPPDPLPGEKPITLEQMSLDALYNAAFAAELNRDFKRAIDLYQRYGREEPDHRKDDRALWSIAGIYRQAGDVTNLSDTLDRWRAKYGRDPGNEDDYVQSYYDVEQLEKRKGRTAQARLAGQAAFDAWKQRGSIKNSKGAKLAGEFVLAEAEEFYDNQFEPFAIKTAARSLAEAKAQNAAANKIRQTAEDKFKLLEQFGVAEYTMAALVRYGDIQYGYATKLSEAPIPTLIAGNDAAVTTFENQRDANLKKFLDEAKQDWMTVLDTAKKAGVSNRWSQIANEDLGREFPGEFTVLRQELLQGTDAP